MWYSAETKELQSNDPAKGYFGELLAERRKGWEQVNDDFRPPTPAPTKQESYASINSTYSIKLQRISIAIKQAGDRGDNNAVAKLRATYTATNTEWKLKLNAVV